MCFRSPQALVAELELSASGAYEGFPGVRIQKPAGEKSVLTLDSSDLSFLVAELRLPDWRLITHAHKTASSQTVH